MPGGGRRSPLHDGSLVTCTRADDDARGPARCTALTRKLLANSVPGVSTGFTRTLEIIGVGYRAEVKGKALQLSLGYSHPIVYQLPPGVEREGRSPGDSITLEGEQPARPRRGGGADPALRPPEPYKGKGIKYAEERVRRKAGKAAGAGGR